MSVCSIFAGPSNDWEPSSIVSDEDQYLVFVCDEKVRGLKGGGQARTKFCEAEASAKEGVSF
jgi:hypothetical protein